MARQPTYTSALRAALKAAGGQEADKAAVRLAYGYAARLDQAGECPECGGHVGEALEQLGPRLLAALTALGMTPAGRSAISGKKGGGDAPASGASPLDELRKRRAARAHGA